MLAVLGIAQLMVVLDATIANVALPDAQADLGFSPEDRQWVITAYALAFGSLLLLGGRLSVRWGQRTTLLIGLLPLRIVTDRTRGGSLIVLALSNIGIFGIARADAALYVAKRGGGQADRAAS